MTVKNESSEEYQPDSSLIELWLLFSKIMSSAVTNRILDTEGAEAADFSYESRHRSSQLNQWQGLIAIDFNYF